MVMSDDFYSHRFFALKCIFLLINYYIVIEILKEKNIQFAV